MEPNTRQEMEQWYWRKEDGNWCAYDPETNEIIEIAFQNNQEFCHATINHVNYTIDLKLPAQYQTDNPSKMRHIQRGREFGGILVGVSPEVPELKPQKSLPPTPLPTVFTSTKTHQLSPFSQSTIPSLIFPTTTTPKTHQPCTDQSLPEPVPISSSPPLSPMSSSLESLSTTPSLASSFSTISLSTSTSNLQGKSKSQIEKELLAKSFDILYKQYKFNIEIILDIISSIKNFIESPSLSQLLLAHEKFWTEQKIKGSLISESEIWKITKIHQNQLNELRNLLQLNQDTNKLGSIHSIYSQPNPIAIPPGLGLSTGPLMVGLAPQTPLITQQNMGLSMMAPPYQSLMLSGVGLPPNQLAGRGHQIGLIGNNLVFTPSHVPQ